MSNQLHKYIALDISTQMLNIARQHQETISYVQRCYIQEDFDDFTRFHTHRDRKSLFMMLGNTITNLVDMQNYLNIFFAMFHKEDMFLV
ncbi:MAG: L-histidine N(alpha)-methyltransferase [bacterium]